MEHVAEQQTGDDLRSTFDSILNRGNSCEPTYSSSVNTIRRPRSGDKTSVLKRISPLGWVVVAAVILALVALHMRRGAATVRHHSPPNQFDDVEQDDAEDPLFQLFDD